MERVNWEEEHGDLGYGKLFEIFWRRRFGSQEFLLEF